MKKTSYLLILLAASLWGTTGIFVRHTTAAGFSVMDLLFFRSAITSFLIFLYIIIKDKALLKIHLKDIWVVIGTGVFSFTFFSFCYFNAMNEVGISIAAVLLYTAPIFVMSMSVILFKEKFTVKKGIAIAVTFIGCCLVSGLNINGLSISVRGLLLGLGAGFGYALYSIFGRYGIIKKYSSLTITFYTFLFAGLASLIFITPVNTIKLAVSSCDNMFWVISISLFTSLIPYISYTKGLVHVPSGTASVMATVEPVVAAIVSVLIYSEPMGTAKIIGIIAILSSVLLLKE